MGRSRTASSRENRRQHQQAFGCWPPQAAVGQRSERATSATNEGHLAAVRVADCNRSNGHRSGQEKMTLLAGHTQAELAKRMREKRRGGKETKGNGWLAFTTKRGREEANHFLPTHVELDYGQRSREYDLMRYRLTDGVLRVARGLEDKG